MSRSPAQGTDVPRSARAEPRVRRGAPVDLHLRDLGLAAGEFAGPALELAVDVVGRQEEIAARQGDPREQHEDARRPAEDPERTIHNPDLRTGGALVPLRWSFR